jgi:hypothetical protein
LLHKEDKRHNRAYVQTETTHKLMTNLPTVRANIIKGEREKIQTQIIYDCGSQKNFLTNCFFEKMKINSKMKKKYI